MSATTHGGDVVMRTVPAAKGCTVCDGCASFSPGSDNERVCGKPRCGHREAEHAPCSRKQYKFGPTDKDPSNRCLSCGLDVVAHVEAEHAPCSLTKEDLLSAPPHLVPNGRCSACGLDVGRHVSRPAKRARHDAEVVAYPLCVIPPAANWETAECPRVMVYCPPAPLPELYFEASDRQCHTIANTVRTLFENDFHITSTEAGLHGIVDSLFYVVALDFLKGRCTVTRERDSHDPQSTVGLCRPDLVVYFDNLPAIIVEEKALGVPLQNAIGDLDRKALPPRLSVSPTLRVAIAGNEVHVREFVALNPEVWSKRRMPRNYLLSSREDRVELAMLTVRFCSYRHRCPIPITATALEGRILKKTSRSTVSCVQSEWGPCILKHYAVSKPSLSQFYSATTSIQGLEHAVGPPDSAIRRRRKFLLQPVCARPLRADEQSIAWPLIARTVVGIHEVGWAHLDVRWSNVLVADDRSYVLVDCEFATRLDGAWPEELPCPDPQNVSRAVTAAADLFSLIALVDEEAAVSTPVAERRAWIQSRLDADA